MNGERNRYFYMPPTARAVMVDLEDNQYLSIDGEVIDFEDAEWLEDSEDRSSSRFLIDGDYSVWLDEDNVEVEV